MVMFATNVIKTSSMYRIVSVFLAVTGLSLIFAGLGVAELEEGGVVGVEVVAILDTDEFGDKLRYPSSVTYNKDMDETYVVAGGEGKVIVYGSNFFPSVSLGKGRKADSPRGVFIDKSSKIYLCQANTENKPGRITLFNPAFFPEKEIVFTSMPEGENFVPKKMVKGLSGNMYVVGHNNRGIMVLDDVGEFSHWLKPMDKLFTANSEEMTRDDGIELPPELAAGIGAEPNIEEQGLSLNMRDLLPPDLLPTIEQDEEAVTDQDLRSVQVADVNTDSAGHLYVLSEETSKIYVYSHTEELLFSFGQKGGSTGKMSRPKSLVIDEKRNALYVVDYMRHTILIFDLSGKFMSEFGGMGTGPGWFQYPVSLALNNVGNLIVADLFNQRVQILDIKFEYKFPLFQSPDQQQDLTPNQEEQTAPRSEGDDMSPPGVEREDDVFLPNPILL